MVDKKIRIDQFFSNANQSGKPLYIAIWNKDLKFTHLTDYAAKLAGYPSGKKMVGLTCSCIKAPAVKSALEFDRQNTKVMRTDKKLHMLDIQTYVFDTVKFFSSLKGPIYSHQGEIIGSYVVCKDLNPPAIQILKEKIITNLTHFVEQKTPLSISLELIDTYETLNLTHRESECFYYIIRGYSNAEIAALMQLSKRTIDDFSNNIKTKLNCYKRRDMIDYAVAFNLIHLLPKTLFNIKMF